MALCMFKNFRTIKLVKTVFVNFLKKDRNCPFVQIIEDRRDLLLSIFF